MYKIVLTKRAEKSLTALPEDVQSRCGDILDELQYSFAPIRLDIIKLKVIQILTEFVWETGELSIMLIKRTN